MCYVKSGDGKIAIRLAGRTLWDPPSSNASLQVPVLYGRAVSE